MAGYIKFAGIDGESTEKGHKTWSDIQSFAQGLSKPGGGGTGVERRRGDTRFEDFSVVKSIDKATPKLQEAVANGKVFDLVEVHLTRSYTDAGRVNYLIYTLKNVQVTHANLAGNGQSEEIPVEQLLLNYEEIKLEYKEAGKAGTEKGSVAYTWKIEEGEA